MRPVTLRLAVSSLNAVFVLAGHSHGLCIRSGTRQLSWKAQHSMLLQEQHDVYNKAVSRAAQAPDDAAAQAEVVLSWAWLEETRQAVAKKAKSAKRQPRRKRLVHAGFARAAKGGSMAVQRWLRSAIAAPRVTLHVPTKEKAAKISEFRTAVGRMDERCCPMRDAEATRQVAAISQQKRRRVCDSQIEAIAGTADVGHARLFVARSTTERLVLKKPERKAASRLPCAAFRRQHGIHRPFGS